MLTDTDETKKLKKQIKTLKRQVEGLRNIQDRLRVSIRNYNSRLTQLEIVFDRHSIEPIALTKPGKLIIKEEDQVDKSTSINNGGTTGYYDTPYPPTLKNKRPTLNDLIEHKKMEFWQGESFKALYAITERSKRTDGSEERELHKIIYYCNRKLRSKDAECTVISKLEASMLKKVDIFISRIDKNLVEDSAEELVHLYDALTEPVGVTM